MSEYKIATDRVMKLAKKINFDVEKLEFGKIDIKNHEDIEYGCDDIDIIEVGIYCTIITNTVYFCYFLLSGYSHKKYK